ncbi:VOC family protein [Methylobacterium organophilum]|uniref:VOC family protein n=1 Tax=Methylobacterium organophilum TaxID=410 RepID=UPI001F134D22|nr:VOC family protein [Methylobacterium organophilum]UMY18134.1 VOC family protein [Methylobacterium organophilum]
MSVPVGALRIAAIRLLCPDPAATAAFYAAAFGGCVAHEGPGIAVSLGAQVVQLVPTPRTPGPPAPSNGTDFQHCAIVVSDMQAAYAHLRAVPGWTPISQAGPERLPAASGGVAAFKFRDPDGHPLELLAFPEPAPSPWRDRPGLFLGIDHTAITVSDTASSVAFYEALGFTVVSRGLNRGAEQARMDAVADPVVEVTGLTPPGGATPHLELLCYRTPGPLLHPLAEDAVLASRIVLRLSRWSAVAERCAEDPDGHRLVFS